MYCRDFSRSSGLCCFLGRASCPLESGADERRAEPRENARGCVPNRAPAMEDGDGPEEALLTFQLDRYNGVEMQAPASAFARVEAFARVLARRIAAWQSEGKGGLWLKLPTVCAGLAGVATAQGFCFHHAKPEYVLLTRWLGTAPSPLPKFAFTQIGVGGVVLNRLGEVLMVQERVSPLPMFQGAWKLPGGLAEPGEDFAETAAREVREETGVGSSLIGVVSLRHTHGVRFAQSDIYVVVKLQAETGEAGSEGRPRITMDPHELSDARWMSRAEIESRVAADGAPLADKVHANTWSMIRPALEGQLIAATSMTPIRPGAKPSVMYAAPRL